MKLISIIVRVYNEEKNIKRAIQCLINQIYENIEIIVVNDGSTDGTLLILEDLQKQDNRIKIFNLSHYGHSRTCKEGIKNAKGTYVTFCDADDYVDKNYIQTLYENIGNADLLCCGYTKEFSDGRSIKFNENLNENTYQNEKMEELKLNLMHPHKSISPMMWCKLFKSELLKQSAELLDDNKVSIGQDRVISYSYILKCKKINVIDFWGYHYTENLNSVTEQADEEYLLKVHNLYENLKAIIKDYPNEEKIRDNLKYSIVCMLRNRMNDKLLLPLEARINTFYYPWYGRLDNKKVILYGAGEVGREYYYEMKKDKSCELVLWVDKNVRFNDKIVHPHNIKETEYDYIVIAVKDENVAANIKDELVQMKINPQIILWNKTYTKWEL